MKATRIGRGVVTALTIVTFVGCAFLLTAAQRYSDASVPYALLLIPLTAAVVLLHEVGHLIGAAVSGMTILGMAVGPLRIERRRRGVRLALIWQRSKAAGYAMAIPDPDGDVRRQMLCFLASGPVANLLAAGILLPFFWHAFVFRSAEWEIVVLVFALLNLHAGVANLIPFTRGLASDGLKMGAWWTNDASIPVRRLVLRLYHYSLRGVSASEVAAADIASLRDDEALGVSFFGHYMALRTAQQRFDREAFSAVIERCREKIQTLDPPTYASVRPLWILMLIEDSFERACAGEAVTFDYDEGALNSVPAFLRYRLFAARSLVEGNEAECRHWLEEARREIANTFDKATLREEPPLLDRIERAIGNARIALAAASAPAPDQCRA